MEMVTSIVLGFLYGWNVMPSIRAWADKTFQNEIVSFLAFAGVSLCGIVVGTIALHFIGL